MDTPNDGPAGPAGAAPVDRPQPADHPGPASHGSALAPLKLPLFQALWVASFVSNIGTWIHNVAASWLMTSLAPTPLWVALVQTATSLPFFLLALPAGALADVLDRRLLLVVTQTWMLLAAAGLGILTLTGAVTAWGLLGFTFLLGLGVALTMPAWMAVIPDLVPPRDMPAAVVLNSVSFNLALAVGPALGGLIVQLWGGQETGSAAAFLLNAVSFLGVIAVLACWRRPVRKSMLPAERVMGAVWAGLRYARHAPALQAVLVRSAAFMVSGSALLALLPLLVKNELGRDVGDYGVMLGFFGAGSAGGALLLPRLRRGLGPDGLVAASTGLYAGALVLLAWVQIFPVACGGALLAGVAWMGLMGTFMVAAQSVVPSWVRARALAIFMLIFQGCMTLGSALWGGLGEYLGISLALTCAAGGLGVGLLGTVRWRLAAGEGLNLAPSMHWPVHTGEGDPEHEEGPVLVVVEYHIDPVRAADFAHAMHPVRLSRLRDGAMRWGLFRDTTDPGRYLETFLVESWGEHLRQHERHTVTDREAEERARAFHVNPKPPVVSHYVADLSP